MNVTPLTAASLASVDKSSTLSGTVLDAVSSMFRRVRREPWTGDPIAMVTKADDLDKPTGVLLNISNNVLI